MSSPYKLLDILHEEVKTNLTLHPQISSLIQLFLKYLKEPRYQSPLTVEELSHLFRKFYQDLNVLTIGLFTQSNTTKKQLISSCEFFNNNPKNFDYLLAIANYSTSSTKLLKRTDDDAMYQLRVFNYYKFLIVFESINLAQFKLFNSINTGDDVTLYDKIFKFDQKDIIYQEFLQDKLLNLRKLNLSFRLFIDSDVGGDHENLIEIMDNFTQEDLMNLQENLNDLSKIEINPYLKLISIVKLHKNLIQLFINKGFQNKHINSDLLLPSLIYLLIYKLESEELYLNFLFIKNFLNVLDAKEVELYNFNLNSSYNPTQERTVTPTTNKLKRGNIFELLNLIENQDQPQNQDFVNDETFKFYNNDKELITYITHKFLNTGELYFYLTNFEAIIEYLANFTISELMSKDQQDLNMDSEVTKLKVLNIPIIKLLEEELLSHFQFPDGTLQDEIKRKQEEKIEQEKTRSRSSSLINTITNRINDTRTRSNSSLKQELFPSLGSDDSSEGTGLSMMRNILGRFSTSSSIPLENQDSQLVSPERRSNSLLNRVAPTHSRTRSSSLEVSNPFMHSKRNSITSKFTTGVTEFMTKLNNPQQQQLQPHIMDSNNSNSSLQSFDNGYSSPTIDVASGSSTVVPKPEAGRSRTTSLQILDKWFNNLNANVTSPVHQRIKSNALPTNHEEPINEVEKLTKYHNIDFENLSIKQLRELKAFYDQFCLELLTNKSPSRNNSLDKLMSKFDDVNSKAESIDSNEKSINGNISSSL